MLAKRHQRSVIFEIRFTCTQHSSSAIVKPPVAEVTVAIPDCVVGLGALQTLCRVKYQYTYIHRILAGLHTSPTNASNGVKVC